MKKNFKRLFALVLTLCMLASLMVPVAFAEDEAVAAPSANVAETYPIRLKDLNHTDPLTATGLDALMVHTNASNVTSYKAPALDADKLVDAYNDGTLNWKYVGTSNEVTYRGTDLAWQIRVKKGWGAFQIRVSDAGLYALNLSMDKNTYETLTNDAITWAGDVTAYIIPAEVANAAIANAVIPEVAEGETAPTAVQVAIPTLMTEDYSVGTVTFAADQTDAAFAKTRIEAGEYVVVISNPQATNLPISEMSLLGDAFEMTEIEKYAIRPFDPATPAEETYANVPHAQKLITVTDNGDGTSSYAYITASSGVAVSKLQTATYYNKGELNWMWLEGAANYRPAVNYELRLTNDVLYVFQIKVNTAGTYALTLSTTNAGTYSADAYALNVNDKPADAAYADLAVAENSLGPVVVNGTGIADSKYYEAGEYIVMIRNTTGGNFPICAMGLSQYDVDAPVESDKVTGTIATYDFELYNMERYAPMFLNEDGTLAMKSFGNEANSGLEGVYEAGQNMNTVFDADYKSGLLNWNRHSNTSGLVIHGSSNMGLRIQSTDGAAVWTALTVKVPVGGIYTADIVSEYASNGAYNVYLLPADSDVATSLTEENKVASYAASSMNVSFAAEFDAGENLVVFEIAQHTKKSTLYVSSLTLSVLDEVVTYDFGLSNDANFIAALRTAIGDETAEPLSNTSLKKWTYTVNDANVEFAPYTTIATLFSEGKMDWALDASSGSYADALNEEDGTYASSGSDMVNFRGGTTLRLCMETEEISYAGLRINVPTAGTYNITTTFTGGAADLYLFKAPNAYKTYNSRLNAGGKNGSLRDMIANAEPFASIDDKTAVGTYTFDQAGEYVLAIVQPVAKSTNLYLSTMVMEPVEINAIADGVGYATFEDAVANATESVVMLRNEQVGNLVVKSGVTLNLNGYTLYAGSVDATAPGAQIIDAQDGKGVVRGEIEFNEDNAQLPLYDVDANGYKLFNVDVVSSATTGSGSATKYWFKVNFSNAAAFDMIGQFTELRIQAAMTWTKDEVDGAAVATAGVDFVQSWAANNTSYIVVTTTGEASGVGSTFRLNPGVTANGVVISGDAMAKN